MMALGSLRVSRRFLLGVESEREGRKRRDEGIHVDEGGHEWRPVKSLMSTAVRIAA